MHRCLIFREGQAPRAAQEPPSEPGGSVWVDLTAPDEEELSAWVLRPLELDPRVALGQARRARLTVRDRCVGLTFVTAAGTPLAVYLGEGRVATVHDRPVPEVEAVWTAYRRAGAEARGESADLTLYRVLERIVDGHERGVDALVARVEALNLDPRSLRDLDVLHRVIGMRREALALRQRIGPTVDLFGLLDGRDFPFVPARHRAYFEDLHERVRGMAGDIDQTRDLLAEDLEAFTSVQSQRVNLIMKVFTIVSVVFLPPTLIASVYGMNFRIPELRWPFGYAYSLALMAATVVAILLYVRRRGWLD